MLLRFHEIAEADHEILNPLSDEKLNLLGRICGLDETKRQLDLACGTGEMLCRWASRYGIGGVGVDISAVFLARARAKANARGLGERIEFVEADAGSYEAEAEAFDVVSCIGATWIGGGLLGTLGIMRRPLRENGLLLVGEVFWRHPPPPEGYAALGVGVSDYTSLDGTLARFESAGLDLIEMVVASEDDFDRYEASQWKTVSDWLAAHPDDADAADLTAWARNNRAAYLRYGRPYLGWAVFVLRERRPDGGGPAVG